METLARALERRRDHYNALFAEARQANPGLQGAELLAHLKRRVAPILASLPAPGGEDRVLEVLYRVSLELLGRGLCGEHARGSLNRVWEDLLPRVAPLIAVAPRRVVAALSNAAFNLDQVPTALPGEWLSRMLACAQHCADVETLLAAGLVAAWRSGLPQYRTGALERCASLSSPLLQALLGWSEVEQAGHLQRFGSSRFVDLQRRAPGLVRVGKVGGFSGYGGTFVSPPRLASVAGALWACDSESSWKIHADAFGALLLRQSLPPASDARTAHSFELSSDGTVCCGALAAHFPELAGAIELVADEELLAVALPRSHYVQLIARAPGAPC